MRIRPRPATNLIALLFSFAILHADEYTLGPDSERQPGVPKGAVTRHEWTSKLYPGTKRNYAVYVPAQYNASKPACVTIFQDGGGFASETGGWRVPIVFDNLIHHGAMPVTIGIFIDPGILPARSPDKQNRYNRSYEYDALGDLYARFLLEEILPEVAKDFNLSANPNDRAIAGSSSGGIAAFVAAWERPDSFRRVLSFIGSYTNLRGADILPNLIRKMEPKPLRVFLQDGSSDQNIYGGNWFLANQAMASALEYSGYDTKFVVGAEGHNGKHGGAILPDALRWLWRDYPKPIEAGKIGKERHVITEILDPDHDWEIVAQGLEFADGPAVDRDGNVFFTDRKTGAIWKAATDGKVTIFKANAGRTSGLMFGADGVLYAAQGAQQRITSFNPAGVETLITADATPNDLAVTSKGAIYFTESAARRIGYLDPKRQKRIVYEGGLQTPNGIRLSPDENLLLVSDSANRWVWSFEIQPDGSLANAQPFYHLETNDDSTATGADGMTVDTEAHLYVATKLGVQICDQAGRVVAIIRKPQPGPLSNLVLRAPICRPSTPPPATNFSPATCAEKDFFPGSR
jgi:gluconolactonase